MDAVALSLAMEHDEVVAASFIVGGLSAPRPPPVGASPKTTDIDAACDDDKKSDRSRSSTRNRVVPIRQRLRNGRSSGAARASSNEAAATGTARLGPRLREELAADATLAEKARSFAARRIVRSLGADDEGAGLGEAALFVQAYALLVHATGTGTGTSAGSGAMFVEDTMTAIGTAIEKLSKCDRSFQDLPPHASTDNISKLALCATILTCCNYPPIGDPACADSEETAAQACWDCLQGLLLRPASVDMAVFSSRVAGFIVGNDIANLRMLVLASISCHESTNRNEEDEIAHLKNVCRWVTSKDAGSTQLTSVHDMGLEINSLVHDPIVVTEAMRRGSPSDKLDKLMKTVFSDPPLCAQIIRHSRVGALLQASVEMLAKRPAPHIPLVLPLSLESLAQALPWDKVGADGEAVENLLAQLAVQIVYAFDFFDREPKSPFVINPRSIPQRKLLVFLKSSHDGCRKKDSGFGSLQGVLKALVSKHCPDILQSISCLNQRDGELLGRPPLVRPETVCEAIFNCLKGGHSVDPSGLKAESIFMACRSVYPCSEVDVVAVRAILTTGSSQTKLYSYVALCKDPLIVLKARALVWKYRGLRCVLLRILHDLMNANEVLVYQSSLTKAVAEEYLVARDTIIVKTIAVACAEGFVFGGSETATKPRKRHCMQSVSMVRTIIAKRRGVIAALIKQELPGFCIDWIIEFVPESLCDAQIITSLLSKHGWLSAAKRLTVASAGLQIAVAHSSRGPRVAKTLVSMATAVLVHSFTFVLGPVGVPVSILRDENGQDTTDICREKMFRMLETLSTINPKNKDLKNEATATLSKIIAMCKNEHGLGGISGVAASKRKVLLQKIWDACVQANTALGGSIEL